MKCAVLHTAWNGHPLQLCYACPGHLQSAARQLVVKVLHIQASAGCRSPVQVDNLEAQHGMRILTTTTSSKQCRLGKLQYEVNGVQGSAYEVCNPVWYQSPELYESRSKLLERKRSLPAWKKAMPCMTQHLVSRCLLLVCLRTAACRMIASLRSRPVVPVPMHVQVTKAETFAEIFCCCGALQQ